MRVLGIDPGLAITGYGIVEDIGGDEMRPIAYGAITTPAHEPIPERLLQIYESLSALIDRHRPDVMAVERLYFGRNVTTAFLVGQARGVILLCAARYYVPVVEYKPAEIKKTLVGYGSADKQQVQFMVRSLLRLSETPRPDDVADALATAVSHVFYARFQQRADEGNNP